MVDGAPCKFLGCIPQLNYAWAKWRNHRKCLYSVFYHLPPFCFFPIPCFMNFWNLIYLCLPGTWMAILALHSNIVKLWPQTSYAHCMFFSFWKCNILHWLIVNVYLGTANSRHKILTIETKCNLHLKISLKCLLSMLSQL